MFLMLSKVCLTPSAHKMSAGMFLFALMMFGDTLARESLVDMGQQPLDVGTAMPNLAIVTTWYGVPLSWAHSWLRYHIAIGFNRIYIFFDNPKHDAKLMEILSNTPEYKDLVKIVKSDERYRKKYWTPQDGGPNGKSEPEQWLLPALGIHLPTEHNARQILNVARAGSLAKLDNIAWLLHVDSDELLWLPGIKSGVAKTFFSQLGSKGVTHAVILNDEVVRKTPDYKSKKLPQDPFHQRLFFMRNEMVLDQRQRDLFQKIQAERKVKPFLGYMCGKGAINVALWRSNFGEASPILPQHVVSFAFSHYHPGNITIINSNSNKPLPYISSKKIKVAYVTSVARILHYVNPDLDTILKKFTARKNFRADIFDSSIVQKSEKKKFEKWQRFWISPEKMPNWEFFNEMWSLVQKGLKSKGDKRAKDFYMRAAVTPQGKALKKYLESGLIYKNKEVMQFVQQISQYLEKKGKKIKGNILMELCNGNRIIGGGSGAQNKVYPTYTCKEKAPHFQCDIQDCCGLLKWPQLTFMKRLLGYVRYAAYEWWKPGLKWPK